MHEPTALAKLQRVPQAPQLSALFWVLVSQPLTTLPSQSAKPELQLAMLQALAAQRGVALGSEHTVPQAPQLVALFATSVHCPAHWTYGQLTLQTPPTHDWPAAQRVPHAPQVASSFLCLAL
jgi:hypothetical protein